jgi:hypothetical protein
MDDDIMNIFQQLTEKGLSHPNITELWREYIVKKVLKLGSTIQHCQEAIDKMDETPDLSQTNILALYNLAYILNIDEQ